MKIKLLAIVLSMAACLSTPQIFTAHSKAKTNQTEPASTTANFAKAWQIQEKCVVSDPTGTPLNIRATPNGKIVGKLKNGTIVYVETYSGDTQDRGWSQVRMTRRGKAKGWVLSDFLDCQN